MELVGVGGGGLCSGGSVLPGTQGRLEHVFLPRAQSQQRETPGELGRAGHGPFSLVGFRAGEEGAPRRCQLGGRA